MPKKKSKKKNISQDFTINDCANAPKPVNRVKKSVVTDATTEEVSWDQAVEDDVDIVEEVGADGTKSFVYKKKRNNSKTVHNDIDDRPGIVYPEIVWYFISFYVKPEEVGNFAGINKVTYGLTKRESFWRNLYKQYCENHPKLPEKLCIDNGYKLYGLRQRVIRALYHTYDVFIKKVIQQSAHDSRPHQLVKRVCVNVWYCKGPVYWSVFFKFKKLCHSQKIKNIDVSFIEELGRIDANPEEDARVLQVTCRSFGGIPPLMGMTLSSVSVVLSQGFRHHKINLGFNTGHYNISRNILPECSVVLDTVVNIYVFDWWHPQYPHFDNRLPSHVRDDEALPMLKTDFFATQDGDV